MTQNGVSLSVSKQSLRQDIDGDTSIIARMRDRVGNAVPERTVIPALSSEGGKVDLITTR